MTSKLIVLIFCNVLTSRSIPNNICIMLQISTGSPKFVVDGEKGRGSRSDKYRVDPYFCTQYYLIQTITPWINVICLQDRYNKNAVS